MSSVFSFIGKDINNTIFIVTGLALFIQGIVTFIYFNLDSTEKLIEADVGTTNKFLQLFEIDFLFNVGLFLGGFGAGMLVKIFEKIILGKILEKEDKITRILIKAIVVLFIIFILFIWAFFLLPKSFMTAKTADNKDTATVTPEQEAHIIYAIQLLVVGGGFVIATILYEVYEIFEEDIARFESKKDVIQIAGGGFLIASILLILQSIFNIIAFVILGFSKGNKWFFGFFVAFLVIGLLGVVGSIALIVV